MTFGSHLYDKYITNHAISQILFFMREGNLTERLMTRMTKKDVVELNRFCKSRKYNRADFVREAIKTHLKNFQTL